MRNATKRLFCAMPLAIVCATFAFFIASSATVLRADDQKKTEKTDQAEKATATKSEFPRDYFFYASDDAHQQKLNELVGKKMPELNVDGWINGEVKADDMKGKVVLIDIWATWCGPCRAAIPHTNELQEKFKDKGLVVVGVCSSKNGQEKLADVVASDKIAYPVCKDPDVKTMKDYSISFFPTYIAIDRKGIVRAAGLRPDKVEKVVETLLEEKAEK